MGEFASLQKDILPIFEEIQQLKDARNNDRKL